LQVIPSVQSVKSDGASTLTGRGFVPVHVRIARAAFRAILCLPRATRGHRKQLQCLGKPPPSRYTEQPAWSGAPRPAGSRCARLNPAPRACHQPVENYVRPTSVHGPQRDCPATMSAPEHGCPVIQQDLAVLAESVARAGNRWNGTGARRAVGATRGLDNTMPVQSSLDRRRGSPQSVGIPLTRVLPGHWVLDDRPGSSKVTTGSKHGVQVLRRLGARQRIQRRGRTRGSVVSRSNHQRRAPRRIEKRCAGSAPAGIDMPLRNITRLRASGDRDVDRDQQRIEPRVPAARLTNAIDCPGRATCRAETFAPLGNSGHHVFDRAGPSVGQRERDPGRCRGAGAGELALSPASVG